MRLRPLALLAVAAIGLGACGDDRSDPPAGFFGVAPQEPPTEADLTRMTEGGVQSYHLVLSWPQIERVEDNYDWSNTDALIERLADHGLQPIPYVFGTPSAYADSVIEPPTSSEQGLEAFDRFLAAAATRYGPGGDFWKAVAETNPELEPRPLEIWEIWNEVNGPSFWGPSPSPSDYASLLKVSARALARIDPNAQLMTAGMFATPGGEEAIESFEFLRKLFRDAEIAEIVDYVGVHPYGPDLESVRKQVERTRRVADRGGADEAGIWVTEIGWGSDPEQGSDLAQTPDRQAELLTDTYEMLLDNRGRWGIEGALWYTWRDPFSEGEGLCGWCRSAGLVDDDLDAKPAWINYAELAGGEA